MLNYIILGKPRNDEIKEAGQLRTVSFYRYIEDNIANASIITAHDNNITNNMLVRTARGVYDYFRVLSLIIFSKNNINILNYHTLVFAHPLDMFAFIKGIIFITVVKISSIMRKGKIIINIHDLPRYQNKDLGYPMYSRDIFYFIFEKILFNYADELWPTANEMASLIKRDYKFSNRKKYRIAINGNINRVGETIIDLSRENGEMYFVYAGTLNRNRGIEEMIDAFISAKNENAKLLILGLDEIEMMKDYSKQNNKIFYLGHKTAEECNAIVSQCDYGIICYPNKFYFNTTFLTKIALYITCEVPILTVNSRIAEQLISNENIGLSCKQEELMEKYQYIYKHRDIAVTFKRNIKKIKNGYYWDTILRNTFQSFFADLNIVNWEKR